MKRKIILIICLMLLLSGCGREDPYRVDTVVRIPVNPTEATEAPTAVPEETAAETDLPTEAETEPETVPEEETTQPTEAQKKPSTGGTGGSKKPSSNKNNQTEEKPTEPPTEPTQPPEEETEAPVETEAIQEETQPPLYDISGYSPGSLEYAIADAINAAREGEGLPALGMNARLSAIASCRGYELTQLWSHTRPDGRGYATVLSDYGYGAGTVTELLVYVTGGDAESIVGKWLESESHRGSILSGSYTTIGVGLYRANGYTYICCLLVG